MREKIDALEHASEILGALRPGVLVTSRAAGRANPMTIGWGTLGVEWGRPVFICYIRTGRFTHGLIEESGEFTVNVPAPRDDAERRRAKEIIGFCGRTSGRDVDKAAELGLTLVDGEAVSAPAIAELPLTLECRVIYRRDQDISLLPGDLRARNYPEDVPGTATGSNRDAHTAYYGEVVDAYILR